MDRPPPNLFNIKRIHSDTRILSSEHGSVVFTILLPIGINVASEFLITLIKWGWKRIQSPKTDSITENKIVDNSKKTIPSLTELVISSDENEVDRVSSKEEIGK